MNKFNLFDGKEKLPKHIATIVVAGSLLSGCGGGGSTESITNTDELSSSSTIKVVDGPVKNASVDLVLEDGTYINIGTTNANGEVVLSKEMLDNLNLNPDSNITIVSTGGEDENGPINVEFKLPVLTASQLQNYVDNNETINVNPTTTFINYVQTKTNYDLQTILSKYIGDKNDDGKVDINDVILSSYNVQDLEKDPNGDGITYVDAVLSGDDTALNADLDYIAQAPSVSISTDKTEVRIGDTFTLTANIQDNGNIASISWYENGKEVSVGSDFVVDADKIGTYSYYVVVIDEDGNEAKSNTITINVVENQIPTISITASATNITEGESVTLTANASDQDVTIDSIIWYDSNENQIGTGNSITITPNSTGTFSYYAIATDNDGASKQSNTITINVEEMTYNASWQTPLQSEVNNVGLEPGVISDASGQQVVINDLVDYTSSLPDGSTFQIVSSVTNGGDETRMTGFSIEGNSLIRDGPNTGGSRTYGTLTIQIIYPDGSNGPTATLDVEIANT